ncbi:MAG TPA: M20/M25/M40 family metallo-hydrolase [bacterium]|nr:M20/M25/M40 family metallo-hydrolase [bacterium]
MTANALHEYVEGHRDRYVETLRTFCRIPSVSNQAVPEAVGFLTGLLRGLGADVVLRETAGAPPLIVGTIPGASARTLLLYNHYDVVPAEPLDAWTSPPFAAEIVDGRLVARGASDNKGELAARLCAVDAWRAVHGTPPLTIKFVIDGEEELGSPHLRELVLANRDLLRADGALGEGGGRDDLGRPTISLGCRGRILFEMERTGARQTFHSSLTSVVPNPAWEIVWAFTSMKGPDERVTIAGFYDDAVRPSEAEVKLLDDLRFDDEGLKRRLGLSKLTLDVRDRDAIRRLLFEPTLEVSGLGAGRTFDGSRGMPRRAVGVVRFGLVPNQDPAKMEGILRRHLDAHGFTGITLRPLSERYPGKVPLEHPMVAAIIRTGRDFYRTSPAIYPVAPWIGAPYHELADPLGIPLINAGMGSAESQFHAPDEGIKVDDYCAGVEFTARLIGELAGAI